MRPGWPVYQEAIIDSDVFFTQVFDRHGAMNVLSFFITGFIKLYGKAQVLAHEVACCCQHHHHQSNNGVKHCNFHVTLISAYSIPFSATGCLLCLPPAQEYSGQGFSAFSPPARPHRCQNVCRLKTDVDLKVAQFHKAGLLVQ